MTIRELTTNCEDVIKILSFQAIRISNIAQFTIMRHYSAPSLKRSHFYDRALQIITSYIQLDNKGIIFAYNVSIKLGVSQLIEG